VTPSEIVAAVRDCGFDVVVGDSGPVLRRTRVKACVPADLMDRVKQNRGELVLFLTRAAPGGEWCRHCGNFVYPGNGVTAEDIAACCLPPHRTGCPFRGTRS
jgi:hypothetical protein